MSTRTDGMGPKRVDAPERRGGLRLLGVQIRIDPSLLIIFALIAYNLGAISLVRWHPDWGAGVRWTVAGVASVAFFASVLLHELSHALVARAQGIPVRKITLFLFGGIAHLEGRPRSPKAEFLMAGVGPVTSIVIGLVATTVGWWVAGVSPGELEADPEAVLRAMGPLATILVWLGPINLILGVFNLVPGFPLDGGRVFRSILWWATGDITRATRWASGAGRGFAWLLMGVGAMSVFRGDLLGGLWLVLIGWFLSKAARASYEDILLHRALRDVPVHRVMITRFDSASPDVTIERLVRHHLMTGEQRAFPVDDSGRFVGLVCVDDVRRVPQRDWDTTTISAIMTPVARLAVLPPDAAAETALEELARREVDQIPIVERGELLGFVRRRDVINWIALQGTPSN